MDEASGDGDDVLLWPATRLAAAIAAGRLSSRELLEAAFTRVDALNGTLNAVIFEDRDAARAKADAADAALRRGERPGPLHGLPTTVKESFSVRGWPSTWGRPDLAGHRPETTAVAVERLEAAGAVVYGKTNVPLLLSDWQTYNAVYGTTHNPWREGVTPGGSSGGSAVAIATGMAAVEIGSDIGASIRNPAHYCGVFGHKPSYGIVPLDGHKLPGVLGEPDLSVAGPLARSAADLETILSVVAGPAGREARGYRLSLPAPRKRRLADFRVGLVLGSPVSAVDGAYRRLLEAFAERLRQAGATVTVGAKPAFDDDEHHETYLRMLRAVTTARQARETFEAALREAPTLAPDDRSYRAMHLRAAVMYHREWLAWNERREAIRAAWDAFFEAYDLLLAPCAASTAFPREEAIPRDDRTILVDGKPAGYNDQLFWAGIASLSYLPSTVAPAGLDETGLPGGVQIIGPYLDDLTPIAFARAAEEEIGGYVPPPLVCGL